MGTRVFPEGWIDWNKLSLDDYCNFLEKKYLIQSTGEAKAIHELIRFYRENKKLTKNLKIMNIKTKFGVNDLVQLKYERTPKDTHHVFVIMEMKTVTCCCGTQTLYYGRSYLMQKDYEKKYPGNEGKFTWIIGPSGSIDRDSEVWRKFREDELVALPKEIAKIFNKRSNP